ncbi:MAG: c-type cytochrome [Planctomycetaceae bacterium]
MIQTLVFLLACLLPQSDASDLLNAVNAERGGRHWIDQQPDPPKSPEESLACFQIEPGSRIELVAAEPLVKDPVWIEFDPRGRMFVAEYGDYPIGPVDEDGNAIEGAEPLSQIVMLDDTDGDGRMDKRIVFADKLQFCHSFMPLMDGILAGAQTEILFLKDTDGDNVADVREVWFDGFEPAHPQMQIGCPVRGSDNWIYLTYAPGNVRCRRPGFETDEPVKMPRQDMKFNPATMEFETVSGLGQFGNTVDRFGHRFFCTNRNPIMMEMIPQAAAKSNPYVTIGTLHTDVGPSGGDTKVFPLVAMKSNYLSHAGTHTSACGVTAYVGELWDDEFQRSVFVCEPVGHLVTRSIIEPIPNSPALTARRARPDADFLASTDTWFRPGSLRTGPDGALYVADMYRMWVEHPKFLPPDIAARIDWRAGEDKGRIWRIVPTDVRRDSGRVTDSEQKNAMGSESHLTDTLLDRAASDNAAVRYAAALACCGPVTPEVVDALKAIVSKPMDHWLRQSVLLAAKDCSGELIAFLVSGDSHNGPAASSGSPQTTPTDPEDHRTGLLHDLASVVGQRGDAGELATTLNAAASCSEDQLSARTAILTGLARGLPRNRGDATAKSLAKLLENPPDGAAAAVPDILATLDAAAECATDRQRSASDRIAAIALLSSQSPDVLTSALKKLLQPGEPTAVQLAAVQAARERFSSETAAVLLENWNGPGPAVKSEALSLLMARTDSTLDLLKAMAAGTISSSFIDIDRRVQLLQHRDDTIRRLAVEVFGDVVSANRKAVAEEYSTALTMDASAERGAAVFEKTCIKCHRINGRGSNVGPDISDTRNRTRDALLYDILDPNRRVDPQFSEYVVVTSDGLTFSGLLVGDTESAIVLRQPEGREQTILRSDIDELQATNKSLMPEGIEKDVSVQQMADLLEFLKSE